MMPNKDKTYSSKAFVFSPDNKKVIDIILKKYPPDRQTSAILPLLHLAQHQSGGWLPQPAIEAVATLLNMPFIRAYEVATFYTMFNLKPVGNYHIQVCRTTPCWLRGSGDILSACESHLGIKPGEVTSDGQFSLTEVECLGACINAPVVQVNDDYHEELTPKSMIQLLQGLADTPSTKSSNPKPNRPKNGKGSR